MASRERGATLEIDGAAHGEVGHVGQEGVDLDHLLDGRARLLEDSLEVGDAGSRLLLDGALNQVALGITGDLARAVDGAGRLDGLGLRSWLEEVRHMCIVGI